MSVYLVKHKSRLQPLPVQNTCEICPVKVQVRTINVIVSLVPVQIVIAIASVDPVLEEEEEEENRGEEWMVSLPQQDSRIAYCLLHGSYIAVSAVHSVLAAFGYNQVIATKTPNGVVALGSEDAVVSFRAVSVPSHALHHDDVLVLTQLIPLCGESKKLTELEAH